MKIIERSYGGQKFRPRPEVFQKDHSDFIIVGTPWGSRANGKKVINSISEFYSVVNQDHEVTSPFQKMSCLSPNANHLRISAMLANDQIFATVNKNEYKIGIELLMMAKMNNEISILQIGQPQVFLKRHDLPLFAVGSVADLTVDYTSSISNQLPPLPSNLLGINNTTNMNIRTFRVSKNDRLLLISHSYLPAEFFKICDSYSSLDVLHQGIANLLPNEPFWIAEVFWD